MVLAVRVIEQIGSYAGLAAIPGLAVLSALYFSQARDVRRLREWAGRAPERAAEQAAGGRPAVQQGAAAQGPAAATPAAATPAAAPPAAAAAKPAVAAAAGATATATATPATEAEPDAAKPDGEAKPDEEAAKEEAPAAASAPAAKPATPAGAAAASAGGGNSTGTATRPGPPAIGGVRPTRTIPRIPSGSQTSILTPASSNGDSGDPWYRRLPAARYIALIVVGVIVLGGGAAFGISRLAEDDAGGGGTSAPAADQRDEDRGRETANGSDGDSERGSAAVDPADVTVTVVNGTTVAGLARDTAAKLSADGFQIGNKVTGTGSLAAAESVVQYKPGAEDEAKLVAERLDINQREPADADAIAQAGPATVIVVLGADQAPGG